MKRLGEVASSAALVGLLLSTAPLRATTYSVTAFHDGVAADGACTLREAIRAAQSNGAVNECPAGEAADTILLANAGEYRYDLGEEVVLSQALEIRGLAPSPADTVVDMLGQNRFLNWSGAGELRVERLTLRGGKAPPGGDGGAFRFSGGTLFMREVAIESSVASSGGGIFLDLGDGLDGDVELVAVRFSENSANGDAAFARGGGLFIRAVESARIRLHGASFEANRAERPSPPGAGYGGGLYLSLLSGDITVELEAVRFTANVASGSSVGDGGGLFVSAGSGCSVSLDDLAFESNLASAGDGPFAEALSMEISGEAAVVGRRLRLFGGAPETPGYVARLAASGAATVLLESSLVANGGGPGLRLSSIDSADVVLSASTVVGSGASGVEAFGSSTVPIRIEGSILWGNAVPPSDLVVLGAGNVDADRLANHNWIGDQGDPDPLFVDPPEGDFSLQALSGAVDAGDSTFASLGPFDAGHAPRVVGVDVDLGAFERGGIFGDGFESEGTWAWSATAP